MSEGGGWAGRNAPRRRLGVVILLTAVAIGASAGSPVEAARVDYPVAGACVQAADLGGGGGAFLDTDEIAVMAGTRCRYTAATMGGYRAVPARDWHVTIERPDGTVRTFSAAARSPLCAADVIAPGDRVEIASTTAIAAGDGVGCAS